MELDRCIMGRSDGVSMRVGKNMFECRKCGSDALEHYCGYVSGIRCLSCGAEWGSN